MNLPTSSTINDFLNELQTRLCARDGLQGVEVLSAPIPFDQAAVESIQFSEVTDNQEPGTLGNRTRDESYTVTGFTWVAKYGAGEETIRQSRDRVFALLAEIEHELVNDFTVGRTVQWARVSTIDLYQGITPDGGRAARVEFTLAVQARIKRPTT
jgi:hypothetical protein